MSSNAYELILSSQPALNFDLEQLDPTIRDAGTLDQIAVELEVQGSGNATSIRTRALAHHAEMMRRARLDLPEAIRITASVVELRLMAWGMLAVSRSVLGYFPETDGHLEYVYGTLERSFSAGVTIGDLYESEDICGEIAAGAYREYDPAAVAAADVMLDMALLVRGLITNTGMSAVDRALSVATGVQSVRLAAISTGAFPKESAEDDLRRFLEALPAYPVRVE